MIKKDKDIINLSEIQAPNKYAILLNPGHNRVYFNASKKLSSCELEIALNSLNCQYRNIKEEYIEDIFYITFEVSKCLTKEEFKILSKLSFLYAFFEVVNIENTIFLKPINLSFKTFIDDSISSILKYTGKTNELFTRMMINIAILSSDTNSEHIKILDPIAGKGTTLYESLIYGYDAYGIEISDKSVIEAFNYLKKYLQLEKYKHNTFTQKISGPNKSFKAKKYEVNIAKNKEDFKNGKSNHFELINCNSMYADNIYKKNSFDAIVGDLPYGVQHGNVTNQKQSSLTRNPSELVSTCISSWKNVLKVGGTVVLAWNSFVLPRNKLEEIINNSGLKVLSDDVYLNFEHRVDQSIKRDIIVAIKI